jgi:predicted tellurium resistance membrane protein TerC
VLYWEKLAAVAVGLSGFAWIVFWFRYLVEPIPFLVNIVLALVLFVGLSLVLTRSSNERSTTASATQATP